MCVGPQSHTSGMIGTDHEIGEAATRRPDWRYDTLRRQRPGHQEPDLLNARVRALHSQGNLLRALLGKDQLLRSVVVEPNSADDAHLAGRALRFLARVA